MRNIEYRLLRLVVNGKSAANPQLRDAVAHVRKQGHRLDVSVTWEEGDAARFAADASGGDCDVIVACGGDGTVNEVVDGIVSKHDSPRAAVAVVPLGTANDFAAGCNLPLRQPQKALEIAATGPVTPIDVGVVNDRHFINVATGGFGAEVTSRTPPDMKQALGGAAYTVMGIITAMTWNPHHCTLTLADGTTHEGDVSVLAVGNGRQAGGGYQLCPRALLDDGLLDLMVVHGANLPSFGTVLYEMNHPDDETNRYASYRQLDSFHIQSQSEMQLNLDGEPMRAKSFQFRVLPRRLPFVLPAGAPLKAAQRSKPS